MKLMGGAAGGNPAAGPAAAPSEEAPLGAPMTTPQANAGDQQAAFTQISMAMDMLEKSLPAFGSETPEGKSLLGALTQLTKGFGQQRAGGADLIPAELQQLLQGLKPSPEQAAMAGAAPAAAPQPMAA